MKSKKILPILLAAFSCLPYTSALEIKQKQSESKQKQAVVGSTDKNSDAKTMNPLMSGGIGLITGIGVAGLSSGLVIYHKDKKIEEEKTKNTNLQQANTSLQQANETLQQDKNTLESRWQSVRDIFLTKPEEKQCTDEEFLNNLKKLNKLNDRLEKAITLMQVLDSNKKSDLDLFSDAPFIMGGEQRPQVNIVSLFGDEMYYKQLTELGKKHLIYYTRSLLALLKFILGNNEPSLSVPDNYKITDDHINNPPFVLNLQ